MGRIEHSKMYILVQQGILLGHQVNCVAHVVLKCYLKYKDDPEMQNWLDHSYKKVTCQVSKEEFEAAKKAANGWVVANESNLDYQEVALAFKPRDEYPSFFRKFRLFG